jgi:hypothetical protein
MIDRLRAHEFSKKLVEAEPGVWDFAPHGEAWLN